MSNVKPMSILILEDDQKTINELEKYIEKRDDVCLVAKTNSSYDALKLVKKYRPEAIIVDLELHFGVGSGFEFLKSLRNTTLNFSPLIVVNTNILSPSIFQNIHEGYADLIFCKQQVDYSYEMVINAIVFSRKHDKESFNIVVEESPEEEQKRITRLINSELDKIGIRYKLKGREYIFCAIDYMLHQDPKTFNDVSPLQYVADKYKMYSSSIGRGIQTAINKAWKRSAVEDLEKFYTAKISASSGVPSAMELIFFYYNKIKEQL